MLPDSFSLQEIPKRKWQQGNIVVRILFDKIIIEAKREKNCAFVRHVVVKVLAKAGKQKHSYTSKTMCYYGWKEVDSNKHKTNIENSKRSKRLAAAYGFNSSTTEMVSRGKSSGFSGRVFFS